MERNNDAHCDTARLEAFHSLATEDTPKATTSKWKSLAFVNNIWPFYPHFSAEQRKKKKNLHQDI